MIKTLVLESPRTSPQRIKHRKVQEAKKQTSFFI